MQRMKMLYGTGATAREVDLTFPMPAFLRDAGGTTSVGVEPFGALTVNNGYQTLFYDEWATSPIDTVDRWTVTGTTPGVASGMMTMVATLSTYNAIQTKDNVRPNAGYTLVRNGIRIEGATAAVGAGRFWGLGTPATTPAAAVLAQNGIGFEVDQATGGLLAVTYAAGVRTTVATLTRPTDGIIHAYGILFRVTQAYWILDGVVVASQAFPNVTIAGLPALIVRQNAAAFTGTPVYDNIAHLTGDSSRPGTILSDPVIGTRMARVTAAGGLQTTTSPTDYARLPATSTSYLASSAASNNLTQIKATAGAIKTIHGYNARTSAVRIKLFGLPSASVTPGTTSAAKSIYIPASTAFVFDFPAGYAPSGGTGLSYMLTTLGGLTDNTAVAAGDILDFNVDYL